MSTVTGTRGAQKNKLEKSKKITQINTIMKNHFKNIPDTKIGWLYFMTDADARGYKDAKK